MIDLAPQMLFRLYVFSFLLRACVATIFQELRQIIPIVCAQPPRVLRNNRLGKVQVSAK